MKKIATSFFIFVLSISSIAQVPGYLGKRFSVGYSNYFFPRMPAISNAIGFIDEDNLSTEHLFNSTHCLDMDYILGARVSFCLSGQFSKMDLFKYGSSFYARKAGGVSGDVFYLPRQKEDMQLKTINFSVGFKFFKERYLNPFGRYRKLELIVMINRIQMDKNGFYSKDYNSGSSALKPYHVGIDADAFNSLALAYTIGKQRIFFNKLIVDWGIRFGMNYSYVFTNLNPVETLADTDYGPNDGSLEGNLKEQANARIMGSQLLNAHVGLRFLAF